MKEGIHPQVYPILYVDGDHSWTGLSTMKTSEVKQIDGIDYYVLNLDISSYSHPFYTGQKKIVDSAGRVEKFNRRYAKQTNTQKS